MWSRSDSGRTGEGTTSEMMLNTDLCLAYASAGKPINARRDECCAWMDSKDIRPEVVDNADGLHCGLPVGPTGASMKAACCDTSQRASEPTSERDLGSQDNCGSPSKLMGFAAGDVLDFAADDDQWLTTFQAAWTKATEKG